MIRSLLAAAALHVLCVASAQLAPEVDDCTVYYREDFDALLQEQVGSESDQNHADLLAQLERRHARRPGDHRNSLLLVRAYADAGRHEEAERLADALLAHRRSRRTDYARVLNYYALRGQLDRARATIERYGRRFGDKRSNAAWDDAVQLFGVVSNDHSGPLDILALQLPIEVRFAAAAELAFVQGDAVTGLLLAEGLYYLGGFTAVPQTLVECSGIVQRELLRSVAHGEGWPFAQYPPESTRAAYADALVTSFAEVLDSIGDYASQLELHADVRVRSQAKWEAATAELRSADDVVTRVMGVAGGVRDDGYLHWLSMARLREVDRAFFNALICSSVAEWSSTQTYFGERMHAMRLSLSEGEWSVD